MIKGHDRSPSSARKSIEWFEKYINQYPDSPLTKDAMSKIQETKEVLAEREIYIGNFYSKKNTPKAAAERYKTVTEEYYDTKYLDEALYLLGKSYIEQNENEMAKLTLNKIINDMPNSEFNDDARNLASKIK